jgi:hypothetical protein
MYAEFWWVNLKGRDHLEDRYRWENNIKIYFKEDVRAWTGLIWLRVGTSCRLCECDNEPLGSIKCREFFD